MNRKRILILSVSMFLFICCIFTLAACNKGNQGAVDTGTDTEVSTAEISLLENGLFAYRINEPPRVR